MNASTKPIEPFDIQIGFSERDIQRMISSAFDQNCSDIKIQSGDYVTVNKGKWYPMSNRALEQTEVERVLAQLAGISAIATLGAGGVVDCDPEFLKDDTRREVLRLRCNAVSSRVGGYKDGISITLRTIPDKLPQLEDMKLSVELAEDLLPEKGFVLIVGATGSGKTTLLTACISKRMDEVPSPAVLTYEDPTEFAYGKKGFGNGPLVRQVSIGQNIKNWELASSTAMRSKGDIIMMGEIRNVAVAEETLAMALSGHCVYSTLHADTPNEAIYRLIEMFPEGGRGATAASLLSSLRVILAQKLITLKSGKRVALRSWFTVNSAIKDDLQSPEYPYSRWAQYVRNYIREKKQDFASQCEPYILDGEMDIKMFREITHYGREEAQAFFDQLIGEANGC